MTRLQAGQYAVPLPTRARGLSVLRDVHTGSGNHPASWSVGTGDSLPRGKAAGACS
jgi:hypothetical protein